MRYTAYTHLHVLIADTSIQESTFVSSIRLASRLIFWKVKRNVKTKASSKRKIHFKPF